MEQLGIDVDVCHLNEGHAAFAVLARTRSFMRATGQSFAAALWATRAGNVFTTHTPVEAAFDRFEPALLEQFTGPVVQMLGISFDQLLALGRRDPDDRREPFTMTYLALRGCGYVNAVSELHGRVSRHLFEVLFPGWPYVEVPVGHVTNGVHVPSWDTEQADALWCQTCGDDLWMGTAAELAEQISRATDEVLWDFRAAARRTLIDYVRRRLIRQLRQRGAALTLVERAAHVLDPNALTLGFARRFAAYKRPNLLLYDAERLVQILLSSERPVQLIVAGKAHPADDEGKRLVQAMARFAARSELFDRVVFLEDYDMALAKRLTAGIDVWLNTPRRPWEASGTSGMKVLVNGGLNLSELDGWWAEAYSPEVGWALGDGLEHPEPGWDAVEANQLYALLEHQIVPEFYTRDMSGVARAWIGRVRASMSRLTPRYSCNRMLREYVDQAYLPAARAYHERAAEKGELAARLHAWQIELADHWKNVHFGDLHVTSAPGAWQFEVQVYLGELNPEFVQVELYADAHEHGGPPTRIVMTRGETMAGAINSHRYRADAPSQHAAENYCPRIVPHHPQARIPLEERHIRWFR
jgi:starch phosphorylase